MLPGARVSEPTSSGARIARRPAAFGAGGFRYDTLPMIRAVVSG
jgi:hypothetical protein